jgi:hypothetical protein
MRLVTASVGQAAGMYGTSFTVGSWVRVGARDSLWGPGIKVSFYKGLVEVGRMVEDD